MPGSTSAVSTSSGLPASSATLPIVNPTPMHQFPRPKHNKLAMSTSAVASTSTLSHSLLHKRSSESFFAKLSPFGHHHHGSSGGSHSRKSSQEGDKPNAPSVFTPLEWSCRGDTPAGLLDDVDIHALLQRVEQTNDIRMMQPAPGRTPSLTHSRASSSDSNLSSASSAPSSYIASLDSKPLPALPEGVSPDLSIRTAAAASGRTHGSKGTIRPYSVAVLDSIDELATSWALSSRQGSSSPSLSSVNALSVSLPASSQQQTSCSLPHLDLAVPPATASSLANSAHPRPASSSSSPSIASTATPRRPGSQWTAFSGASPKTVWTPRDSTCYTPGCLSVTEDESMLGGNSPFALESTLARQELLASIRDTSKIALSGISDSDRSSAMLVSGVLPESDDTFLLPRRGSRKGNTQQAEGHRILGERKASTGSVSNALWPVLFAELNIDTPDCEGWEDATEAKESGVEEISEETPDEDTSDSASSAGSYITPLDDIVEEDSPELPIPAINSVRRATINKHANRLSLSGGGWRGWRATSSQPSTPADELPPALASQTSTENALSSSGPGDYFGSVLLGRLNSITEAISPEADSPPVQAKHVPVPLVLLDLPSPSSKRNAQTTEPVSRSTSPLPKLSPEFSFGRRTPSPAPSEQNASHLFQSQSQVGLTAPDSDPEKRAITVVSMRRFSKELPPSALPVPGTRRARAASADYLASRANSRPAAPVTSASAPLASAQQTTGGAAHRSRLAQRKQAGSGPRLQARSFDAEELNLLRNMGRPKYGWV